MKTTIAVLVSLTAFGTASASAADTTLPKDMLGVFCFSSEQGAYWPNEIKPCGKDSDGKLIMKPNGYDAHEEKCRFISIKQTGRYTAATTKASWPDSWTPVLKIVANCVGEGGEKWVKRFDLSLGKSTYLTIQDELGLAKNDILAIEKSRGER
jgi:hypothetical protein